MRTHEEAVGTGVVLGWLLRFGGLFGAAAVYPLVKYNVLEISINRAQLEAQQHNPYFGTAKRVLNSVQQHPQHTITGLLIGLVIRSRIIR
jgi:hypothetical protein